MKRCVFEVTFEAKNAGIDSDAGTGRNRPLAESKPATKTKGAVVMKRVFKIGVAIVVSGVGAASAQVDLRDLLRPVVRLRGDGAETVINCPWDQKLSLKLSKEAPAAVVKCIDGGPGVEFDFRGF